VEEGEGWGRMGELFGFGKIFVLKSFKFCIFLLSLLFLGKLCFCHCSLKKMLMLYYDFKKQIINMDIFISLCIF
jgi:hypothetical protein